MPPAADAMFAAADAMPATDAMTETKPEPKRRGILGKRLSFAHFRGRVRKAAEVTMVTDSALPGCDHVNVAHNVTSSEFVYYRIYHNYRAIATKRPAYLNDRHIGRIRSEWVTPPHTAGSLRLCLSSMENINPDKTKLFVSPFNQSALADEAPISFKNHLGIIPEDPVILFSKEMPQDEMKRGMESFRVAPDSESPVAPRFLFYGVYTEAGVLESKAPIDAEKPWVSKIDLDLIMPPVSVPRLLHILNMREGINTSPQLLAQDGPLGDDQILTKDGNWLGASVNDHLVLKFGRPPFAEGPHYRIQNCSTGNVLGFRNYSTQVHIYLPGYNDDRRKHFTLRLRRDGSVAFRNVHYGNWIGPDLCSIEMKHGFWLIPSTNVKNCFFICEGDPVSRRAFYDAPVVSDAAHSYSLKLRELDTTDTRQLWSFIPTVVSSPQTRLGSVESAVSRLLLLLW